MIVKGLDGLEYRWRPELHHSKENPSGPHERARNLIRSLFPFYSINEEIPLIGTPCKLYLDMYVHPLRLAIEVHGEQHYKFNSFFFASAKDFRRAKQRDALKVEWCVLNGIDLVELPYNETDEQWKVRINERGKTI